MSDIVIRAENLGKKYRIQHQHEQQRYFEIKHDKVVGITNRNDAGN